MRLSLFLGLVARAQARRLEAVGTLDDVDEVESLSTYMDCRYTCPSLLRMRPPN